MEPRDQNQALAISPVGQKPLLSMARATVGEGADCWNKIGVAGDGTCPELSKVIHCRNCPVYSAAGLALLDQEPPPNYRRDWTEHFSREKNQAVAGPNSAVIFRLGAEWLALPTRAFQEVLEERRVHSLPDRRRGIVLGLINVRGELLICVSLGRLLGIESAKGLETPPWAPHRLVVAEWLGNILAFPVDEIRGLHRYHPEELKPLPATVAKAETNFATGLLAWQDKRVGCLDADLLFATLNRSLS